MGKERFNQIIDEVFINYCQTKIEKTSTGEIWISYAGHYGIISKEDFINKCKTDNEFSQEWGLHIEERELSLEERAKWLQDNKGYDLLVGNLEHDHIREVVEEESPTRITTITYKNETIETYE